MSLFSFDGRTPKIGRECFVAETADVVGNVKIGNRCYIGFRAVIRADYGWIVIGDETAVEEGCVCHAKPGEGLYIGRRVTLGHGAIVHGGEIQDEVVIGMGAVVGFDAVIGEGAVVAEGAVIKAGTILPPRVLAAGVPAKVVGEIDATRRRFIHHVKQVYIDLARTYADRLRRVETDDCPAHQ